MKRKSRKAERTDSLESSTKRLMLRSWQQCEDISKEQSAALKVLFAGVDWRVQIIESLFDTRYGIVLGIELIGQGQLPSSSIISLDSWIV